MAASAACYTLHSWSTGLSLFKEKRRTQCEMLLGRGETNTHKHERGMNMTAVRENTLDNQTEDVKEFISLLKDLDYGEKREIKGIMIGIRLTKQLNAAARV